MTLYLLPCHVAEIQHPHPRHDAKYHARRSVKGMFGLRDTHPKRGAGNLTCQQHVRMHIIIGAAPLGAYAPRFISAHPGLIVF